LSLIFPILKNIIIPPIPHSLASTALGLLLVFRTNASYDRFSEGRKTWSSIVMALRDIAITSFIHIDKIHHKKIAALLMMFTICLKQHLQGEFIASGTTTTTNTTTSTSPPPMSLLLILILH